MSTHNTLNFNTLIRRSSVQRPITICNDEFDSIFGLHMGTPISKILTASRQYCVFGLESYWGIGSWVFGWV